MSPDEIEEKPKAHIEGAEGHDFRIFVDNYSMPFKSDFFMLGITDRDWHTPLQTVIRTNRGSTATRKRAATKEAERKAVTRQTKRTRRAAERAAGQPGRTW